MRIMRTILAYASIILASILLLAFLISTLGFFTSIITEQNVSLRSSIIISFIATIFIIAGPGIALLIIGIRNLPRIAKKIEEKRSIHANIQTSSRKTEHLNQIMQQKEATLQCAINEYQQTIQELAELRSRIDHANTQKEELHSELESLHNEIEQEKSNIRTKLKEKYELAYDVSITDGMDGHDFEYFCAALLNKNGFTDVHVTPGSGDQGVDILAEKFGVRYAIQCKNYASKLGNTPIQEVNAGKMFYKCDIGVVLTNSTFTPAAIELANSTNIKLWDRSELQRLMADASQLMNMR